MSEDRLRRRETSSGARQFDVVFHNGTIRTLDKVGRVTDALGIAGSRIAAVGPGAIDAGRTDANTVVVDLGGRTMVPAFTDSHIHFQKGALQRRYYVDFLDLKPIRLADVFDALRARSQAIARGDWVRAEALNEHALAEGRMPTRWELDAVTEGRPAIVIGVGNHAMSANSAALQLAGLTRDTADPPGGRLQRDERGELTGILFERGKLNLDPASPDSVLPGLTQRDRVEAIARESAYLHRLGIVAIHDILTESDEVAAYLSLWERNELRLRVQMYLRLVESGISIDEILAIGLRQPFGDEWLQIGGVKVSIDGICVSKNAAVYEPYPGEPNNRGLIRVPSEELTSLVCRAHAGGIRVAVHAIGQQAVDIALNAFQTAARLQDPGPALPHRIEHAYLPPRAGQLTRIKSLDLVVSTQPSFLHEFGDTWRQIWGNDAMQSVLPLRQCLDLQIQTIASSDYPCVDADPLQGIAAAVNRETRSGDVIGPAESITASEALSMYTSAAADAAGDGRVRGTLEVGKYADLVILSADPLAVPSEQIERIRVLLTMVGGRVVYADEEFHGIAERPIGQRERQGTAGRLER